MIDKPPVLGQTNAVGIHQAGILEPFRLTALQVRRRRWKATATEKSLAPDNGLFAAVTLKLSIPSLDVQPHDRSTTERILDQTGLTFGDGLDGRDGIGPLRHERLIVQRRVQIFGSPFRNQITRQQYACF